MKKSRFTDSQIMSILKQTEAVILPSIYGRLASARCFLQ